MISLGEHSEQAGSIAINELCREGAFSDATFCKYYKWRAKFGGTDVPIPRSFDSSRARPL